MFKELFEVFKKGNLMEQAFNLSLHMLKEDREIFNSSIKVLRDQDASLDFDIKARDKQINDYQVEVRKKILAHLAISGASDLTSGLILQRAVNDIERIGDFNKNIVSLATKYPSKLNGGVFEDDLSKIETIMSNMFDELIICMETSNIEKGTEIINNHQTVNRTCKDCVTKLLKDDNLDFPSNQAACLTLYFRYLKRISSHMKRVAKSVVEPFSEQ